jgi:hypothetical protein
MWSWTGLRPDVVGAGYFFFGNRPYQKANSNKKPVSKNKPVPLAIPTA